MADLVLSKYCAKYFSFSSILVVLCAVVTNLQPCQGMHGVRASVGQPWPMPAYMATTKTRQILAEDYFRFSVGTNQCDLLEHAFRRYHLIIFNDHEKTNFMYHPKNTAVLKRLVVTVKTPCTEPQKPLPDMDESYELKVAAGMDGQLTSNTIWGALRGLETFSQLVYESEDGSLVINSTMINDEPRFSHRGVLLDTSRHFLSMENLMKALDGMSFNKFNVFHWHIVDDDSFPYVSYNFPELSQKGAFDPYEHVYTQEDVFRVIEYARTLGIRVVPEFDTPGHTLSWGKSHPEFLTKCFKEGAFTGRYGPVDPSQNSSFALVEKLLDEVVRVFKDEYIHLGGDEVSFDCWMSNPNITQFMKKMGFGTDYARLEEFYMQRILNYVNALKRKTSAIIWQEVIDNGVKVPQSTVAHVWKIKGYQEELAKVTSLGHRTLLSACWYLDKISYGKDWMTYYQCEPYDFNGSAAQKALVFGGEAALWGELVDNTNVQQRLWPRASAVAERLWSPAKVNNVDLAASRLEEQRCRLIARGIPAQPVNGPGFCRHEWGAEKEALSKSASLDERMRFQQEVAHQDGGRMHL